jgi:lipoprotein-anchoring transpeptidase ErfK/SrfK
MYTTPAQALQKAQEALQRGDKLSARRWAEFVVAAAPGMEEGWLMLAAVSSPRASIEYLGRALQINPKSQRARRGLEWAQKRLELQGPTKRVEPRTAPRRRVRKKIQPLRWLAAILLLLLAFALVFSLAGLAQGKALPVPAGSATLGAPTATPSQPPFPSPTAFRYPTYTATLAILPPPTQTASPVPTMLPATKTAYTVQPGDSLASLSLWFGVPAQAILAANNLPDQSALTPGLSLFIPPQEYIVPPASFPPPKTILVDISEQHLYAYEGETLVYSFVASTGMGNSTRIGTFKVLDKIPNAYGGTWNIWMPNWLGIYWSGHLENGIHALPILPNGATLWAGFLGQPISYGCIVLGSYESKLLYDWVEVGIPVIIQR